MLIGCIPIPLLCTKKHLGCVWQGIIPKWAANWTSNSILCKVFWVLLILRIFVLLWIKESMYIHIHTHTHVCVCVHTHIRSYIHRTQRGWACIRNYFFSLILNKMAALPIHFSTACCIVACAYCHIFSYCTRQFNFFLTFEDVWPSDFVISWSHWVAPSLHTLFSSRFCFEEVFIWLSSAFDFG